MIFTSYYASKKWDKENAISISLKCPVKKLPQDLRLAPTWNIFTAYKKSGKWLDFKEGFKNEVLAHLDPHQIAEELDGKVLLCFEGPTKNCHRHLVADWLRSFGYDVQEL